MVQHVSSVMLGSVPGPFAGLDPPAALFFYSRNRNRMAKIRQLVRRGEVIE